MSIVCQTTLEHQQVSAVLGDNFSLQHCGSYRTELACLISHPEKYLNLLIIVSGLVEINASTFIMTLV